MAVTLVEHVRKIVDPMERGVFKSWLEHAPFLRMMTVDDLGREQTEWMVEETLPTVGWRSANEAFAESTGTTSRRSTNLGWLGGLIDIDAAFLNDPTRVNESALQMNMKSRAMGYTLANTIVNGSVASDPETFDGLLQLVTSLNTRNSRQVVNASGLDLTTGTARATNADTFLHYFRQAVSRVETYCGSRPDFAIMSENMKLLIPDMISRSGHFTTSRDNYDREVETLYGVKLYHAGWYAVTQAGGTEIMTDTWDGDGYTSIIMVKNGGEYTSLITNGGMQKLHIGLTDNGVWDRWKLEHHVGLRVKDNGSIVRLRGLDITV